jgi:hypothetical protein
VCNNGDVLVFGIPALAGVRLCMSLAACGWRWQALREARPI